MTISKTSLLGICGLLWGQSSGQPPALSPVPALPRDPSAIVVIKPEAFCQFLARLGDFDGRRVELSGILTAQALFREIDPVAGQCRPPMLQGVESIATSVHLGSTPQSLHQSDAATRALFDLMNDWVWNHSQRSFATPVLAVGTIEVAKPNRNYPHGYKGWGPGNALPAVLWVEKVVERADDRQLDRFFAR